MCTKPYSMRGAWLLCLLVKNCPFRVPTALSEPCCALSGTQAEQECRPLLGREGMKGERDDNRWQPHLDHVLHAELHIEGQLHVVLGQDGRPGGWVPPQAAEDSGVALPLLVDPKRRGKGWRCFHEDRADPEVRGPASPGAATGSTSQAGSVHRHK